MSINLFSSIQNTLFRIYHQLVRGRNFTWWERVIFSLLLGGNRLSLFIFSWREGITGRERVKLLHGGKGYIHHYIRRRNNLFFT